MSSSFQPHPDSEAIAIKCAIITVSDTRSVETDKTGKLIQELLEETGHLVREYTIIQDEASQIESLLLKLGDRPDIEAIIFNGGTGIASRDNTFDAISGLLEKTIPGFGELFRFLSYQEIGTRALASRAIAGIYAQKLVFSLPGSPHAARLALSQLILPELVHLVKQLRKN
jgi:molybdopterin adenylyltransferase